MVIPLRFATRANWRMARFRQGDGKIIFAMVTDVSESGVTLDANHPLAGEDLTFDIQLIEIS